MKFSEISIFASVFSDLQKQLPGLVPPLGLAIAQLAGFDMKCTKPLDLDLALPQQTHFFQSKLYSSFLREHLSVHLGETKGNAKASATDRLSEIKLLLFDDLLPAKETAGLEIMAFVFGNADFATKLFFLFFFSSHLFSRAGSGWSCFTGQCPGMCHLYTGGSGCAGKQGQVQATAP